MEVGRDRYLVCLEVARMIITSICWTAEKLASPEVIERHPETKKSERGSGANYFKNKIFTTTSMTI